MSEYDEEFEEEYYCLDCGDPLDVEREGWGSCNECVENNEEEIEVPSGENSITGLPLQLIGQDGNAFMILGLAQKALRRADLYDKFWNEYNEKATSGDYNKLLATTMEYFEVY